MSPLDTCHVEKKEHLKESNKVEVMLPNAPFSQTVSLVYIVIHIT